MHKPLPETDWSTRPSEGAKLSPVGLMSSICVVLTSRKLANLTHRDQAPLSGWLLQDSTWTTRWVPVEMTLEATCKDWVYSFTSWRRSRHAGRSWASSWARSGSSSSPGSSRMAGTGRSSTSSCWRPRYLRWFSCAPVGSFGIGRTRTSRHPRYGARRNGGQRGSFFRMEVSHGTAGDLRLATGVGQAVSPGAGCLRPRQATPNPDLSVGDRVGGATSAKKLSKEKLRVSKPAGPNQEGAAKVKRNPLVSA